MLRYKVKFGDDDFKKSELVWDEKYLSPDLSFISGITSTDYHLEKFNELEATNTIINSSGIVKLESENVTRQGFVVVNNKEYKANPSSIVDYSIADSGVTIDYHYTKINDKYFYWSKFQGEENSGYTIDNLLTYYNGEIKDLLEVECEEDASTFSANTVYWIEDGYVTIDGERYFYDKNEGENGVLKYREDGAPMDASAITKCSAITFYPYSSATEYQEVTKFKLTKNEEITREFKQITYLRYLFYIDYKDNLCYIRKKEDGDSYSFVCDIPTYVISGGSDLSTVEKNVYFCIGEKSDDPITVYKASIESGMTLDSNHYNEHGIKELDELNHIDAFVYLEEEDAIFTVDHTIMNANNGSMVGIYTEEEHLPLNVGENVILANYSNPSEFLQVYNASGYGGAFDDEYVMYNGDKYPIQKNLCDKVVIARYEYDIDYRYGREESADCVVRIVDEDVRMRIETLSAVTDNDGYCGTLRRYGLIVSDVNSWATSATYKIKSYDGALIHGNKCILREILSNDEEKDEKQVVMRYVETTSPTRLTFTITEIIGSSLYVCKPYVSNTYFTDDFGRYISNKICTDAVSNQASLTLYVKNKIFGESNITEELPFEIIANPRSSDSFYDLFDNLKIFVRNSYVSIPIMFRADTASDQLQDDLIERDFYEAEKKKAINPIVDMEKDVYVPKRIVSNDGKYSGSSTEFSPIRTINLNFHFRTRNLSTWKVNDAYSNVTSSADTMLESNAVYLEDGSNDNWFITDMYPYREIINRAITRTKSGRTLQETSDLMGLLYFTNDDIFYQKSKVAKSFARISLYDSTDPQTQSLLATSCVFVDEHKLFKRFIDNSRKNLYEYGGVVEPTYSADTSGFINPSAPNGRKKDITELHKYNKISVSSEFLGLKKDNIYYSNPSADSKNVVIDEERRIGSRLTIENKYETSTSSEGYYFYIFKEYSENLHPKPIYMKIEFNHAGIGKTIPFLIPMRWSGNTEDRNERNYNKMFPVSALTLSNASDVMLLKEGIPLSYVYAQTYIPLYAVYDFINKEYGYVFDSRYVTESEDGSINLNLFELKVRDDSNASVTDKESIDIQTHMQNKAVINVNIEQFDAKDFNYRTE